MRMPDQTFEDAYSRARCRAGVKTNSELSADEKLELVKHLKKIFQRHCNREFPADPYEQLHMAIAAIFDWRKSYYTANHNSSIVSEIQDLPSALVMIEAIVSGNNKEFSLSGSDKRSIASSVANKGELNLSRGKGSENKIITRKIATSREKYLKRLTLQAWPPRVDLEWGNKELEELHIRE